MKRPMKKIIPLTKLILHEKTQVKHRSWSIRLSIVQFISLLLMILSSVLLLRRYLETAHLKIPIIFLDESSTSWQINSALNSIDDFLFHGDLGHASNMNLLKQLDIRHIVNICDCELDDEIKQAFEVLWINLDDTLGVDIRQHFDKTNDFLLKCKEKNEKVLVNCQMGISRSSTIVLAYLMKYHHDTLLKAYDYLLDKRRHASPNYSFLLQLIRYEEELRRTKDIDENKHNDDKKNPILTVDVVADEQAQVQAEPSKKTD